MYKVSLIISSIVFLLVLGFVVFSYKPEGKLANNTANNSAAAVLSVPEEGVDLLHQFKRIFAHPVDPTDTVAQ